MAGIIDYRSILDTFGTVVARAWFKDQCCNLHTKYYLWYRPADPGELAACPMHSEDNPNPERWKLADSEAIPCYLSESQVAAWISNRLRRLLILNPK